MVGYSGLAALSLRGNVSCVCQRFPGLQGNHSVPVFFAMPPPVGFSCAWIQKEDYEDRCAQPEAFDLEGTLQMIGDRWTDLPPKQSDRVRLQGQEFLGLFRCWPDHL